MTEQLSFERFEYKYAVPHAASDDLRRYIAPYLRPDPYCARSPSGRYVITNQYWDSPGLAFYWAHACGSVDRFKLRVRTYGDPETTDRYYFEIKRRVRQVIVKQRAGVSAALCAAALDGDPDAVEDRSRRTFDRFTGLALQYGARPNMLIRYEREAFENVFDEDARLTFDRAISYQPVDEGRPWGDPRAWRFVDDAETLCEVRGAMLMELKFSRFYPPWMTEVLRKFDVVRTSFSKYLTTIQHEVERGTRDYDRLPRSVVRAGHCPAPALEPAADVGLPAPGRTGG
jgi:hypothetical protein